MEYILTLRAVNKSDLSSTQRFLPEDEEVEVCLQSIVGELDALECLAGVKREGTVFHLSARPDVDFDQIRKELKPILSGSFAELVRYISLE